MKTNLEISHAIATQVLGWTQIDDSMYKDAEGFYVYLTNWAESIPHAIDLAALQQVALKPVTDGWEAWQLSDPTVVGTDSSAAKSIALCVLAINNIEP